MKPSAASMKPKLSGVAKWSVLRSVTCRAEGSAATRSSAGWTKSLSPTTINTGQVTAASCSVVSSGARGRRITAARAATSLPG